jgi:hypothetical protein
LTPWPSRTQDLRVPNQRLPFPSQAWWVGDSFSADLWRVCTNSTNCTEINELTGPEAFEGECGWLGHHHSHIPSLLRLGRPSQVRSISADPGLSACSLSLYVMLTEPQKQSAVVINWTHQDSLLSPEAVFLGLCSWCSMPPCGNSCITAL